MSQANMCGYNGASSLGLVLALAFASLLGGCASNNDYTHLEAYDEVRTKDDIERVKGVGYGLIAPSGWRMEITNFTSGQALDRKIRLPRLPKFSIRSGTIFYLFVPHGEEDKFKDIGGTITLKLVGQGKSWGATAELDSLTTCRSFQNYMYIDEFTYIDFPDNPDFVPEYAHIIFKPDKTSIDMPAKVVLRSGGGK